MGSREDTITAVIKALRPIDSLQSFIELCRYVSLRLDEALKVDRQRRISTLKPLGLVPRGLFQWYKTQGRLIQSTQLYGLDQEI